MFQMDDQDQRWVSQISWEICCKFSAVDRYMMFTVFIFYSSILPHLSISDTLLLYSKIYFAVAMSLNIYPCPG